MMVIDIKLRNKEMLYSYDFKSIVVEGEKLNIVYYADKYYNMKSLIIDRKNIQKINIY